MPYYEAALAAANAAAAPDPYRPAVGGAEIAGKDGPKAANACDIN